jgi:hypothetical protein
LALCCASFVASRWENRCGFVSVCWLRCSPAAGCVIFIVSFVVVVVVVFVVILIVVLVDVFVGGAVLARGLVVVAGSFFCVWSARPVDADLAVGCRRVPCSDSG